MTIYSNVRNERIKFRLTMMEDQIISVMHVQRQFVNIQPFLNIICAFLDISQIFDSSLSCVMGKFC